MTFDKKIDLEELDTVSKRLKYIVDTLGVKQSHMANKLGVSPSGLHYILNNDIKFSKNAKKIADYLNINENWLTTGEGNIYEKNHSIKTYKIPVYYPDQLKLHYSSQKKDNIAANDFFISTIAYLHKTIGIYMTETNFTPKFEIGDVIIFEQVKDFQEGEILLTYLSRKNNIALKNGFHLGNDIVLLSHDEPTFKLDFQSGDLIIGAYRECLKRSRRI